MITVMTTATPGSVPVPGNGTRGVQMGRSKQPGAAATGADDDVSSFPHENSRNKNYDNHNFFSCLPERNGGRDRGRKREKQSVDLCFVSHWTKESLAPPTLPLPPCPRYFWAKLASSFCLATALFLLSRAYKSMLLDMQKSSKGIKDL